MIGQFPPDAQRLDAIIDEAVLKDRAR